MGPGLRRDDDENRGYSRFPEVGIYKDDKLPEQLSPKVMATISRQGRSESNTLICSRAGATRQLLPGLKTTGYSMLHATKLFFRLRCGLTISCKSGSLA